MSGGGKTSTSSSTATIPPDVLARYNSVNAVAQNVAQTPFQTYSSDPNAFVAAPNSMQQAGAANTNAYAGAAQPWYSAAGQNLMQSQQAAMPYYDTAGNYYSNAAQTGAAYAGASTNALQSAAGAAQPLQNAAAYNISNAPGAAQPYFDTAGQNLNQGLQTGSQLGQNSYNTLQGAQQTGAGLAGASYAGIQQALQTGAGLGQTSYNTLLGANSNASPYLQAAAGYGLAGSQAVNPTQLNAAAINQYMSPFLNNVYGATLAGENQQNAQQMSSLQGTAAQAGAFGGDRAGIAAANMAYQQNLANAQTNANLLNTGYTNALNTAGQQQALGLGAGQANRAALQQASNQMLGLGQQQFNQGATTAAQQAALGQQQYGQQANAAQQYAALSQQQFSQGATAAQQQAALGQLMFGQAATAAQQQAAMGLGQANLMSTAGQQEAALGQQQFSQDATIAAQLAALSQQQFGQGQASGAAAQGLGAGLYGMGASTSQQLANFGAGSQTAGLQGAQAQMAAGLPAQQAQQAALTALYNQWMQGNAYPFQTTQFLTNIAEGTGALSGGTTASTTPTGLLGRARGGRAQRYSGGLVNASMGGHVYPKHGGEGYAEGGSPAAAAPAAQAAPSQAAPVAAGFGGGQGASSFFNTPTGNAAGQGMGFQGFAAAPQFPTASASWFNAAPTLSPPPKFPTASASGLGSFPAFSPQSIPQMQSFAPSQASMAKDFGLTDPAPFRDPVNTKMAPWQQIIADQVAAEAAAKAAAAAKAQAAGVGGTGVISGGYGGGEGLNAGDGQEYGPDIPALNAQAQANTLNGISAQGFMNRGGRIHKAYAGAVSGATGPGGVDPLYLQAQMQMLQNSQNLPGAGLNLTGMPMSAAAAQPGIVPTTRNIMAGGPLPVSRSTIPPAPRMQAPTGLVGGIKELASDYRGLKDAYNTGSSALFGTKGTPAQGNTPAVDPSKGLFGNAGSSGGGYFQDWFAPQKARGGLIGRHHYKDGGSYDRYSNPEDDTAHVPTHLDIPIEQSPKGSSLISPPPSSGGSGGGSGGGMGKALGSIIGGGAGSFFGPVGTVVGSGLGGLLGGLFAHGGLVGRHGYAAGGPPPFDVTDDAPDAQGDQRPNRDAVDAARSMLLNSSPSWLNSAGQEINNALIRGANNWQRTTAGGGMGTQPRPDQDMPQQASWDKLTPRPRYSQLAGPEMSNEMMLSKLDAENAAWLAEHPPYDSAPTPPEMGERNFNPETELYANAPVARSDLAQNSLMHPAQPWQPGPLKEDRGLFPNLPPSGEGNVNYLPGRKSEIPDFIAKKLENVDFSPEQYAKNEQNNFDKRPRGEAPTPDQALLETTLRRLRLQQFEKEHAQGQAPTAGLVAPVAAEQGAAPAPAVTTAATVPQAVPPLAGGEQEVRARPVPVSAPGTSQDNYPPGTGPMNIRDFIKSKESYSPTAKWDYKQYSVGYGTRATSPDEKLDRHQAEARLDTELAKAQAEVDAAAQAAGVTLAPNQRDALTSFGMNLGGGAVQEVFKASNGNVSKIPELMQRYNQAGGEVQPGLVKRRAEERDIFNGQYPTTQSNGAASPTAVTGGLVGPAAPSAASTGVSAPQAAGLAPAGLQAPAATAVGAGPYQQLQSQPLNWFQRNQDLLRALAGGVDKGAGALRWSQFIPRFAAGAAQGYAEGQKDLGSLAAQEAGTQQTAMQTSQIPMNSAIAQANNLAIMSRNAMFHTNDGTEWIMTEQGPMQTNIWKTMAEGQRPKPLGLSQAMAAISRIPGASPGPMVNPLGNLNNSSAPSQGEQGQPTGGATALGNAGRTTAEQELKLGVINPSYLPSPEKRQAAETAIRTSADGARATGNLVNQMASAVMKIPEGSWASGGITSAARTQVVKIWNDLINALPGNDDAKKDYKIAESDLGNTAAVNKIATALAYANASAAGQQSAFALDAASKMVPTNLNTKNEAIAIIPGLYVNKQRLIDQSKYLDDYKNFVASQNGGAFAGYYNPQSAMTAHSKDFNDTYYLSEQEALKKLFTSRGRDGTTMFEAVVQNAQSRPDLIEKMAATPGNPLYGMNAKNLLRYFTNN